MGSLQVQVREEVSRGRRSRRQVARGEARARDRAMVRASPSFRFLTAETSIQCRTLAAESCHSYCSAICKVKSVREAFK